MLLSSLKKEQIKIGMRVFRNLKVNSRFGIIKDVFDDGTITINWDDGNVDCQYIIWFDATRTVDYDFFIVSIGKTK